MVSKGFKKKRNCFLIVLSLPIFCPLPLHPFMYCQVFPLWIDSHLCPRHSCCHQLHLSAIIMLSKSHSSKTYTVLFKISFTAREVSRWLINTGLKRGIFQPVFLYTAAVLTSWTLVALEDSRCLAYWHQKHRSDCLRGLTQPPLWHLLIWFGRWVLPLAPVLSSTFHLENSVPFPRCKAMEKPIPFIIILNIIVDQTGTDLLGQDYLQQVSSQPCPFTHSPNCILYLFFSRHTGELYATDIHLVMRTR